MKPILYLLLLAAIYLTGCSSINTNYQTITPKAAVEKLQNDKMVVLLDVRTPEEYAEKHIQDSLLIPDYDIDLEIERQIPNKDTEIIVYCRSGNRSKKVANKLLSIGYKNVYDLGGINNYPYSEDVVRNS